MKEETITIYLRIIKEKPVSIMKFIVKSSFCLWIKLFNQKIYLHHYFPRLNGKKMETSPLPKLKDKDFITLVPKLN